MLSNRWSSSTLDSYRGLGDPQADSVIEKVFTLDQVDAVNQLLRNIQKNDDLVAVEMPDELEDFLNTTDDWPTWADQEQIRLGQQLFSRYGMQMTMALFCWSLPSCYSCAKGAQVLGQTQRITKRVHQRLIETAQFVLDVMAENGLEPTGRGVRTAQKIRLLHTTIRYHIRQSPHWSAEYGVPINQEDMAGTMLSFALLPQVLTKMGMDFTEQEEAAFFHCWRVIGSIMGIQEEMLPQDVEDGKALWDAILTRHAAPSDVGQELTAALVDYMKERVPGQMFDGIVTTLIRELCEQRVVDAIGIERANWTRFFLRPLRWIFGATDEMQDRSKVAARLSGAFSRRLIEGLHYIEREGQKTEFSIPKNLQDSWGLNLREK
ncbi:MAG TPA: oxygenase MpaB family protein [Nostocaceae cyanobacterium]|nr:oxygenase MpaB family protein [Nostocaceae cyanobacterium]